MNVLTAIGIIGAILSSLFALGGSSSPAAVEFASIACVACASIIFAGLLGLATTRPERHPARPVAWAAEFALALASLPMILMTVTLTALSLLPLLLFMLPLWLTTSTAESRPPLKPRAPHVEPAGRPA